MILKVLKSHFFGNKFIKIGMLQPNTNVSETIDSSESLIKQLRYEIIFLRVKLRDKNNSVKCVLGQLSKGNGAVCSDTGRPSYRK